MDIYPSKTTSPTDSTSLRKRKAAPLDRNSAAKFISGRSMSLSASYQRVTSSWSPVHGDLIRPIKSLDDMLISSYRASLSHHSYSTFEPGIEKVDKCDPQLSLGDAKEMRDVNENTSKALMENMSICNKESLNRGNDDNMNVPEGHIRVHQFYSRKRTVCKGHHFPVTKPETQANPMQKQSHLRSEEVRGCSQNSDFSDKSGIRNCRIPKLHFKLWSPNRRSRKVQPEKTSTVIEDGVIINTNVQDLSAHKNKMTRVHRSHTPPTQSSYVWYKAKKAMDNVSRDLPERLESLYYAQRTHSQDFSLFPSKCNKVKMNWTNVWDFKNKVKTVCDFGIYDLSSKSLVFDEEVPPPLKHDVRKRLQKGRNLCYPVGSYFKSGWTF